MIHSCHALSEPTSLQDNTHWAETFCLFPEDVGITTDLYPLTCSKAYRRGHLAGCYFLCKLADSSLCPGLIDLSEATTVHVCTHFTIPCSVQALPSRHCLGLDLSVAHHRLCGALPSHALIIPVVKIPMLLELAVLIASHRRTSAPKARRGISGL